MARMANYLLSKQDVINLLSQLGKVHIKYPPELLAARRKLYLDLAAQLAVTRDAVAAKRKQLISSTLRDPDSVVVGVLIVLFAAFLIAFVAHAIAAGEVNLVRLIGLLSR